MVSKVWDEITYPLQTLMMEPLTVGNGWVISLHTAQKKKVQILRLWKMLVQEYLKK